MTGITLTEADRGRLIDLAAGDRLTVRLAETPGTGYRWEIAPGADPGLAGGLSAVLTGEGDRFAASESALPRPGVGGLRIFSFRAGEAGTATLSFRLRRPWEAEAAAVDTVTVTVRVTASTPSR
jgi:predicted secreted protein